MMTTLNVMLIAGPSCHTIIMNVASYCKIDVDMVSKTKGDKQIF